MKAGAEAGAQNSHPVEINHLTNLYGYVGWLTKNEEYMKKAHESFAGAIRGDNPPCYTSNGAWTKESGKRLRYGHLLQYIHWLKTQKK